MSIQTIALPDEEVAEVGAPPTVNDRPAVRVRWAVLISVIANLILWRGVANISRQRFHRRPDLIRITRVTLPRAPKPPKTVRPKVIHRPVVKPKPKPMPKPPKPRPRSVLSRPVPRPVRRVSRPKPVRAAQRPPQGAHHRILTALPGKGLARPNDHTVLAGGNAHVGKPIDRQNPGNAVVNPPVPVPSNRPPTHVEPPTPQPAPQVTHVRPQPAPQPPSMETNPTPPPPPPPPPKPKGPTRAAQPENQVKPEIPEELKQGDYKSFVRVKVVIEPDGSANPALRTSSGNAEIDRRVLEALKRWTWKPALRDGEPVESTQLFRFDFEVD